MGSADIDGYDVALLRMGCRHDGTGAHRSAPASIAEAPCSASLAPTRMNPNSSRPVPLPAIGGEAGARPSKAIGASLTSRQPATASSRTTSPSRKRDNGPPPIASGVTWIAAGTLPLAPDMRPSVTSAPLKPLHTETRREGKECY